MGSGSILPREIACKIGLPKSTQKSDLRGFRAIFQKLDRMDFFVLCWAQLSERVKISGMQRGLMVERYRIVRLNQVLVKTVPCGFYSSSSFVKNKGLIAITAWKWHGTSSKYCNLVMPHRNMRVVNWISAWYFQLTLSFFTSPMLCGFVCVWVLWRL